MANKYVHDSILKLINLGKGIPVNSPVFSMYEDASRYRAVVALEAGLISLMKINQFRELIPETQTNFVLALPFATKTNQVAAVDGRIVKTADGFRPAGRVKFGASKHIASAVIAFMKYNPLILSAINIRCDRKLVETCSSLYDIAEYRRAEEPFKFKHIEGKTVSWGVTKAISENYKAEIIYHKGEMNKEAMILIFGRDPMDVVAKLGEIIRVMYPPKG
jgi:hydroxymethylpyrimidine/phosphomethylpyrimidine kinase